MTPIRQQYLKIKRRYPDAIVFFRLGDFYETFDEDAKLTSRELDIVLTSRGMGKGLKAPMAGIPAHALDPYLARLINKGHKVAICEQLSDPAASKGLVERDVVRVVTPGTLVEPSLLEEKANNYLAALVAEGDQAGLSYVDISTAEFRTTQLPQDELALEVDRLSPSELLVPQEFALEGWPAESRGYDRSTGGAQYMVTHLPTDVLHVEDARQFLREHFGVATLEGFGCATLPLAIVAAATIIEYLSNTQPASLEHLTALNTYSTTAYVNLDQQTRRNLELFHGGRWGNSPSLLSTLDLTRTAMGGRLLRRWLGQPLKDFGELTRRQDSVAFFHRNLLRREKVVTHLSRITDIERVLNRVRLGAVAPRELAALKTSLTSASELLAIFEEEDAQDISWLRKVILTFDDVVGLIDQSLAPNPTGVPGEGNVIKEGFSPELDELRTASRNAREYIAGLERKERDRTGIKTLRVGYNKVFGYHIEVSKSGLSKVPADYIRRQTLVGGERFITPELKEYESRILSARERIEDLERTLYLQVCNQIGERAPALLSLADGVAHIDVLAALGEVASRYGYVRPVLAEDGPIEIKAGRHPVVERVMPPGTFVPNDTSLSTEEAQLIVLTGPNMAGKSTYIRQVALITLMAQVGSFVPAESTRIGLVDRIFTRVGLQDDLATGQSTFMTEMVETASILNQATPRSMVILDEIGRGTSTYDGLSIARSVVEYIHNNPRLGCMTLFATHYHELTELANALPRVRNFTVAVSEEGGEVVFLHRIVPGGADKSYGIHVAQLAGLPKSVVNRAWEVLRDLERDGRRQPGERGTTRPRKASSIQMPLFDGSSQLEQELARLDVANLTPLEAINKLYELQKKAQGSQDKGDHARGSGG